MSITIKKATCTDATDILEYFKQIGAETDNLTFGAEGLPFTIESEAAYISQIENSCDAIMLIAKENGKIVGDASLSRLPRRMNLPYFRGYCPGSLPRREFPCFR